MKNRKWIMVFLSLAAIFPMITATGVHADQGDTERVSVDSAGTEGNNSSYNTAISDNGRFVAFLSTATNLVPGDTSGTGDIFVHDRQTGETTRVSAPANGDEPDGWAGSPDITPDGRFVTFTSGSTNLVSGDTNNSDDIFVHDRQTGEITRVSINTSDVQGNSNCNAGAVSEDGRFVAFSSESTNLVSGDNNGSPDIFLRDRLNGVTTRVSVATSGAEANDYCGRPAISADGYFIAFYSTASNLVDGDTNNRADIFIRERLTGETTRVSISTGGVEANGDNDEPQLSEDGRYVIFHSEANNFVSGDTNGYRDVFLRDRQEGTTEMVSVNDAGEQGDYQSHYGDITPDGRYVAFDSQARNLVSGDINFRNDVFIRDLHTGEIVRASVSTLGEEGDGDSYRPALSGDGRFVVFNSSATNLVGGDTNGVYDDFVHDLFGPQSTVSAGLSCVPSSGTVPFDVTITATLFNNEADFPRRVAARIDLDLANGLHYSNWKAGWSNIAAGNFFEATFNDTIAGQGKFIGDNLFTLIAEDVTPVPYNQSPYPPAGDTATASCTVTGMAP